MFNYFIQNESKKNCKTERLPDINVHQSSSNDGLIVFVYTNLDYKVAAHFLSIKQKLDSIENVSHATACQAHVLSAGFFL